MTHLPHIPIYRFGSYYRSYDTADVLDTRTARPVATVSQANPGLIRRDALQLATRSAELRQLRTADLIDICAKAADLFLHATLPLNPDGQSQTPEDYVQTLAATSGLPHVLVRNNMSKCQYVLAHMREILDGLTRGLSLDALDAGIGTQAGVDVAFFPHAHLLGAILPSNSPGVNSIWLPSIALKIPILLKPGKDEPWTPWRLLQALLAAGCPGQLLGFYPTSHAGSADIMDIADHAIIFGDQKTVKRYAGNPNVQAHGPGWSKVILADDQADHWQQHLPVMLRSILDNGGRSCINASTIVTPRHAGAIAEALAQELAKVLPRPAADPAAQLSAFANPAFAEAMDAAIDAALAAPGAVDVTQAFRPASHPHRKATLDGATYLLPTLIYCKSPSHSLAFTEYMFPFASVVEVPQQEILSHIGPTLVASVITADPAFTADCLACPHIDRLNLGPIPTSQVRWDQPHEGNLFEFLYKRRAIQMA